MGGNKPVEASQSWQWDASPALPILGSPGGCSTHSHDQVPRFIAYVHRKEKLFSRRLYAYPRLKSHVPASVRTCWHVGFRINLKELTENEKHIQLSRFHLSMDQIERIAKFCKLWRIFHNRKKTDVSRFFNVYRSWLQSSDNLKTLR